MLIEGGLRVVTAPNPGFMTVDGTNQYLLGETRLTLIDAALGGRHIRLRCVERRFRALEVGKWNEWAPREEQNHRMGPAVFGKLALGDHQVIKYNAAWLLGASQAAPGHILRAQVEYEF